MNTPTQFTVTETLNGGYSVRVSISGLPLDETGQPTARYKWDSRRYRTEEDACDRVDMLKDYGIWPGVVRYRDGTFGLTYDPVRSGLALRKSGT